MRNTISVQGARENNLKNIDVEIPREQFVVLTGLSGSGKSSLAFKTIYAEGQRRFLESLSTFSRKFVNQLKKPNIDFIYGLSPVISIEQKFASKNPRSTVGTMTDIFDYLRVLYATSGTAHCPYCRTEVPVRTPVQIAEHIMSLPEGTLVEIDVPIFKIYGEDFAYLFGEIRSKGYRRMRVNDELVDLSDDVELDETQTYDLEVVIDRVVVHPDIYKSLLVSIQNALQVGEANIRIRILATPNGKHANGKQKSRHAGHFYDGFACPEHHVLMGEMLPYYFAFNDPDSACPTCLGLGSYLHVHPNLLVHHKNRSIREGAFIPEAFKYDKNNWATRMLNSVAHHYGFSLETPYCDLSPEAVNLVLYGTQGERFPLILPEGAAKGEEHLGKLFRFDGIVNEIERRYRRYRREKVAHSWMEEYLRRVMVEQVCPDCHDNKLKRQRLLVTIGGKNIMELSDLSLSETRDFLVNLPSLLRQPQAGAQIIHEVQARLDLLLDIGLDYLSLGRKAVTLSGGESQRVRLSVQIGSELMGMLYVLDEPSIGLHPRDNHRMIHTLQRLRDIGNTVIVVEHDEATIRAADHIIEIGPGPGVHGGEVVAQGTIDDFLHNPHSLTGQYLSGQKYIPLPTQRRAPQKEWLTVRGATENNLREIDVAIPLGLFVCVTGVSGSGKSTLVNDILYKRLHAHFYDSRTLSGAHAGIDGIEHIRAVINIDQSPIGRTPTSNPATYIGIYDTIRQLFAETAESKARGYDAARFSFNVKSGRCEECAGQGLVTTSLQFMPDVEVLCQVCKGARYNEETLEIQYNGKNIAQVLDMSIESAAHFFAHIPLLATKLKVLVQLGMGYLKLGQSSTTISGGEAQRVKLAHELGKVRRGGRKLYILDEPTTGLHLADIQRLLDSLVHLVDAGNTVLVIEHHLDVIKSADWIIDMGPEGGRLGGLVVAQGTPEQVANTPGSFTGQYLRDLLPAVSPPSPPTPPRDAAIIAAARSAA